MEGASPDCWQGFGAESLTILSPGRKIRSDQAYIFQMSFSYLSGFFFADRDIKLDRTRGENEYEAEVLNNKKRQGLWGEQGADRTGGNKALEGQSVSWDLDSMPWTLLPPLSPALLLKGWVGEGGPFLAFSSHLLPRVSETHRGRSDHRA
jgi:hypothetical protein